MKVFLIAGEASGDRLGAALLAGLRQLAPEVSFAGVGGSEMTAQGLVSQFPMQELSVMGLIEILPKYFHLKRRIAEVAAAILEQRPDVVVTIDSPDFCLRVARLVKAKAAIPIIHYVAPSVWAWRPKRAEKLRGVVDHVLALLPFEPPYLARAGVPCTFVGHPVTTEPLPATEAVRTWRTATAGESPLVLMLPGSRKGEVRRLLPIFLDTARRLRTQRPDLQFALPVAPGLRGLVEELIGDFAVTLVEGSDKALAFGAADVALAASGTVSLELAAHGTPMVIAYDMNRLTFWIMQRLLLTDTVTLVNLVAGSRSIREFLGPKCNADNLVPALLDLIDNPVARNAQQVAMSQSMQLLGQGAEPPGLRAARVVLAATKTV